MISLSRVKEATNEFVKVLRFGKKDVKTPNHVTPHGIESKPVKGDLAVHAATTNDNETVCLGYIKNCQKVGVGETCVYATDSEGDRVFEVYLRSDGVAELGGNENEGLIKIKEFVNRINDLEKDVMAVQDAIRQWTPVPSDGGAALKTYLLSSIQTTQNITQTTNKQKYENAKVVH